jgi:hypothetical protein
VTLAADLATGDPGRRSSAKRVATAILDKHFGTGLPPARISTWFLAAVARETGNPDPFAAHKAREVAFARDLASRWGLASATLSRGEAARVALAGNALDFFRPLEDVARDLAPVRQMPLAVDDLDLAWAGLTRGSRVLVLADNAGEQFLDAPLLAALTRDGHHVAYGIKSAPVQNDLSVVDLDPTWVPAGVRVVTTGGAAVGAWLDGSSEPFRGEVREADLVVLKGMGHFETLGDLAGKRCLVLLRAKCGPVAEALQVARDAFVAKLVEVRPVGARRGSGPG